MKRLNKTTIFLLVILILISVSTLDLKAFNYTEDVQKVTLDNGITLLLKENPAYDIIALAIMSNVGSIQDPIELEGLTYLTQRNLISGTAQRTSEELVMELESWGVQLQTAASYDYSGILLQTMPSTFDKSFAILMDIMNNSTFPEQEFEKERILSEMQLQSLTDDPTNAVLLSYLDLFYGEHPYKNTPYGSDVGLATIRREDSYDWYKYIYQPQHLVISVVGNFAVDELLPMLEDNFGTWTNDYAGIHYPRKEVSYAYPTENREIEINVPLEAAFLVIGYPAPDSFDEDSAAMTVINSILGGGMSSRLFTEIRDKRGLVYTAVSQYDARLGPSNILTFLATHPLNLAQAKQQLLIEIERFATEGLTEEEIAQVAIQEKGLYLLGNETNMSQATTLAMAELTGRGFEWVDEYMLFFDDVTTEDIKNAAQKYFQYYTGVTITP